MAEPQYLQIEHRCDTCNKIIRFEKVKVPENAPAEWFEKFPYQTFDTLCKSCQEEADEGR